MEIIQVPLHCLCMADKGQYISTGRADLVKDMKQSKMK